jgi:hypothetical protein
VPGGERPSVSGVLREADQQQRDGGDADHSQMRTNDVEVRDLRGRQPARYVAHQRDAVRAEVEQTADDEDERAGDDRRREPQADNDDERRQPNGESRPVELAEPADPRAELAPGVDPLGGRAGQLRQLADHDVDRGSGEKPRDDSLRDLSSARGKPRSNKSSSGGLLP